MEGIFEGKSSDLLRIGKGLVYGMATLSLIYPFVFVFGVSRVSTIILMYGIVLSSVVASFIPNSSNEKGIYRVVHARGEFVDELIGKKGNMLVFRKRMINENAVYMMERVKKEKGRKESLHEYFH